jgi:hypothetical protein
MYEVVHTEGCYPCGSLPFSCIKQRRANVTAIFSFTKARRR